MSLKEYIFKKISEKGFLSLSSLIRIVNTNPNSGYYRTKKNIIGKNGDFITSPEISPQFSKAIVRKIVSHYVLNNLSFDKINLIELGPGNFRLIQDILGDHLFLRKFLRF